MTEEIDSIIKLIFHNICYLWQHYGWLPSSLWQSAFTCGHTQAIPGEGKSFCPDCGQGIVYRWHIMRCTNCNSRRDAQYYLRHWLPLHRFCPNCGENSIIEEPLENPKYHQLHKAYLVAIPAHEFEKQFYCPPKVNWQFTSNFSPAPILALTSH